MDNAMLLLWSKEHGIDHACPYVLGQTCEICTVQYEQSIVAPPATLRACMAEFMKLIVNLTSSAASNSSWPWGHRRAQFLAKWYGEAKPFRMREHRGSLGESMSALHEVWSMADLRETVRRELAAWVDVADKGIHVEPYGDDDARVGWRDTHVVTVEGYGVFAFVERGAELLKLENPPLKAPSHE